MDQFHQVAAEGPSGGPGILERPQASGQLRQAASHKRSGHHQAVAPHAGSTGRNQLGSNEPILKALADH